MSTSASVNNYIAFSGDQSSELSFASGELEDSVAMQQLYTLAIGNNEIEVPDIDDFTVHGVAIVPPALNEEELTLKGVNGDTGLTLNAIQVTMLQFGATPPASIVINVAAEVVGLRLIWF